jgi:hypothetical protein
MMRTWSDYHKNLTNLIAETLRLERSMHYIYILQVSHSVFCIYSRVNILSGSFTRRRREEIAQIKEDRLCGESVLSDGWRNGQGRMRPEIKNLQT